MNRVDKKRLDQILVDNNYTSSREKAKGLIMSGKVFVGGEKVDKPGTKIKTDLAIEIKGESHPYVSRGGLKLEKALTTFSLDVNNKICLDVGASTGGFTHCLLLNGAACVYAVDVGYGQLAWKLRCDERVVIIERTNIKNVSKEQFGSKLPEIACVDVSFISLTQVLPKLTEILTLPKLVISLIKPQFELEKNKIGKKGVVKDSNYQEEAIKKVALLANELGFNLHGLTFSPIKGPKGNIEYLAYFKGKDEAKDYGSQTNNFEDEFDNIKLNKKIKNVILHAHEELSTN